MNMTSLGKPEGRSTSLCQGKLNLAQSRSAIFRLVSWARIRHASIALSMVWFWFETRSSMRRLSALQILVTRVRPPISSLSIYTPSALIGGCVRCMDRTTYSSPGCVSGLLRDARRLSNAGCTTISHLAKPSRRQLQNKSNK